ncbi:MAG: hypothetical protein CO182_05340, partial [Lysobacterales bacterium CG_4_9_14_3_um_filter_62_6]
MWLSTARTCHVARGGHKRALLMTFLLMMALGVAGSWGCWGERGSCDLWAGKLSAGQEATVAVKQLADSHCVAQRGLLLAHLGDQDLGSDVLAALVALGRSPEAEQAVVAALGKPETVVVAAQQVAAWKLAAAEDP